MPDSSRGQDHPAAFSPVTLDTESEVVVVGVTRRGGRWSMISAVGLIATEVKPNDRSTVPVRP
jgi:hypothetical protein